MVAQYSAFLQNLLMSGMFISLFIKRKGSKGQSVLLAVAKWMGVLIFNPVVLVCGIFCTIFDVIYIILLIKVKTF